jgi:predicted ArsR family transcriptional regulator
MSILLNTLREVNAMNVYSREHLARRLDTSQEVVNHILSKLEKMGYIKEENIAISKCSSCPSFKNGCMGPVTGGRPITTLTITDKGKRFLDM